MAKIYTSYFDVARSIPGNPVLFSVSANPPSWFKGHALDELIPHYSDEMLLKINGGDKWKAQKSYDYDVLSEVYRPELLQKFARIGGNRDIVMLCNEPPNAFCHRHFIAMWLGAFTPVIEWVAPLPPKLEQIGFSVL